MRNSDLDKVLPEDSEIGELKQREDGNYRVIHGKKIHQIEEMCQGDIDLNLIINRIRASKKHT